MNYYEVQFTYTSPIDTEIINDVLASELGEIGFESFTSNENGLTAYISEKLYDTEAIKDKIRQTKVGNKNPMAKKIKRINIFTNEIDTFDTIISCAKACGIQSGKTSITNRLNGKIKNPFKNTWKFEYYDE